MMETNEEFYNRILSLDIEERKQITSDEEARFLDIFSEKENVPRKNCLFLDRENRTVKTNMMSIIVEA